MYSAEISEVAKSIMPEPKGWKVLIAIPQIKEKTSGGIYIPDDLRQRESSASIFGYVVALGDLAYMDEKKFPTGPWCKAGDWVLFRSYSGTRLMVDEQEFRLINDDTVEAVVESPEGIMRAF